MYFLKQILFALPLAMLASANCLKDGDESNQDERNTISSDANMSNLCSDLQGPFPHYPVTGHTRSHCMNIGRGHYLVTMSNTIKRDENLSLQNCIAWSRQEIGRCYRHGRTNHGAFLIEYVCFFLFQLYDGSDYLRQC